MRTVRTRFAPSPTGYIHVGGIRTALFAWLTARHAGGQFILRLEDTDKAREVEGAKDHIVESLKVLGLDYDEGPFIQSERLDIYKQWAEKLVALGRAYSDPYSKEELTGFRKEAEAKHQPFLYRHHRPDKLEPPAEGKPLRFLSKPKGYSWNDIVMGDLSFGEEAIDDFILIKSDGYPTYNFAHIVDDIEMKISHVIRGQEFISSVPNYLNLYEALSKEPPIYATMPHVLTKEGNKKLSKRDGVKDILSYIKEGYLPEALISFIATLGWNDGTTQEIFTMQELIEKFDLSKVQKSGAKFDEQRLNWVNGTLIRALDLKNLAEKVKDYWPQEAKYYDDNYRERVLSLVQERLKYFSELSDLTRFFFIDLPINKELLEHKNFKDLSLEGLKSLLEKARASLSDSDFSLEDLTKRLNALLEETNQKPAVLFSLIRIASTQAPASPGLADTLSVLGKDTSLRRIDQQIDALK
jgi:glutamyl-tRNA synthetase